MYDIIKCFRSLEVERRKAAMGCLGVDLGGSSVVRFGVRFSKDEILKMTLKLSVSREDQLKSIPDLIVQIVQRPEFAIYKISRIGVAVAGEIPEGKDVVNSARYRAVNYPLRESIQRVLQEAFPDSDPLPVFIGNNTALAGLAELKVGQGKDHQNFFYLDLGHDLSGALILRSQVVTSPEGNFGQISHLKIWDRTQGKNVYFDRLVSGRNVFDILKEKYGYTSLEEALLAVRQNHQEVKEFFRQLGQWLGVAIRQISPLFGVKKVVIGGGIVLAYDYLWPGIEIEIKDSSIIVMKTALAPPAYLPQFASLLGATFFAENEGVL